VKSLGARGVSVRFGAVQALAGVEVTVDSGQTVLLAGPNGAGKTTLLRVVLGLVRPDAGAIEVDGRGHAVDNALKQQIGYLPEAVAFSENLTGRQVLRFFAWARGVPRARVDAVLERVGLAGAARRRVRGYSRGMRQRLGLGVAILAEPELLILDEPTGGLDSEGLAVLWSILAEWRERGRMVLLSSHQLALLERRIDRMYVFKAGKHVAGGTPAQLREQARLRLRVHLALAPAGDAVTALAAELDGWSAAAVARVDGTLVAEIEPNALLELMDVRGRHRDAVTGLRIEEPTLDLAYERLLEQA